MIIAALDELYQQVPNHPRLKQALDYLIQARGQDLPDGRYEVSGQEVVALVQSYQTIPAVENAKYEAHRRFIDIQYIVSGVEGMGWAPLDQMHASGSFNEEKDIVNGACPSTIATMVKVAAGQAVIFFPEDAHAPKLAVSEPCPVKKIVMKVLV